MTQICSALQAYIPFDYFAGGLRETDETGYKGLGLLRIGFDEYQILGVDELLTVSRISHEELLELQANSRIDTTPTIYDDDKLKEAVKTKTLKKLIVDVFEMKSHMTLPLELSSGTYFHLFLYSRRSNAYNSEHLAVFSRIEALLIKLIGTTMESKLTKGSTPLVSLSVARTFERPSEFKDIIGNSHKLLGVLDEVVQVAPYETTVLILGES